MKFYFAACLYFFVFVNNISYSQNYECDNQFDDCGTPDQSGGGGKGSVLIANTDLGDTYQNADDFDDDGIEDGSDNCMRYSNPDQFDRDGDGVGDACDNCLDSFNPQQKNTDNDDLGNLCDDDMDGDNILNYLDSCPKQWGEVCNTGIENSSYMQNYNSPVIKNNNKEHSKIYEKNPNCNQKKETVENIFVIFLGILLFFFFF